MALTSQLIQTIRGDSKTFPLTLQNPDDGTPFDPSDHFLILTVKARTSDGAGDSSALVQKSSVAGITVIAAAAATEQIEVEFVTLDTARLSVRSVSVFDVQAEHSVTGAVKTVAIGAIANKPDVTEATVTTIPIYTTEPGAGGGGATSWAALTGKPTTLVGFGITDAASDAELAAVVAAFADSLTGKSNTGHTHAIADVTGLQSALDGKAASSHAHTVSQISDSTALGRALVAAADAAAGRTSLGLAATDSPTFSGITSASVTAAAATSLVLGGGSSGASLTLGQGASGVATASRQFRIAHGATPSEGSFLATANGLGALGFNVYSPDNTWIGFDSNWTATQHVAASTTAFLLYKQGSLDFYGNSGLTVGVAYTPARLMRLATTGNLLIGGTTDIAGAGGLKVFGTTAATSSTTGALQVAGGISAVGAAYVGGTVFAAGQLRSDGTGARNAVTTTGGDSNLQLHHPASGAVRIYNSGNGGLALGLDSSGNASGSVKVWDTTEAITAGTASLVAAGGIYAAKKIISASQIVAGAGTTTLSSLSVPHGVAPTSPVNGDVWTTTAGIYVRVNGATVGPLGAGLPALGSAFQVLRVNAGATAVEFATPAGGGDLTAANNLSELTATAGTARTNLGLGTLATQSGTFSGTSSGTNTGDQSSVSGNAGTATALATPRNINGVAFDGSGNITVTAAGSTLSDTVPYAKGGTGLTALGSALDVVRVNAAGTALEFAAPSGGGGDMLSTLTAAEISITGATTATIGRMHVCSGTTADYTVTLPAVSGNTGKFIGFRMASGLTKLVTLDGNASETIDGTATRIMIANESATLYCDGSAWAKVAGKSQSIRIAARDNTSDQSISANTVTVLDLAVATEDLYGSVDLSANSITIKRASKYILVCACFYYDISATSSEMDASVRLNGADNWQRDRRYIEYLGVTYATQSYPKVNVPVSLAAGDVLIPTLYSGPATAKTLAGPSAVYSFIELVELPSW